MSDDSETEDQLTLHGIDSDTGFSDDSHNGQSSSSSQLAASSCLGPARADSVSSSGASSTKLETESDDSAALLNPPTPHTPAALLAGMASPLEGCLSPPAGGISGRSVDPVHDLPPELLHAGWRCFWSRRERRPYFFNKLTNESRWEMPPISGQVSDVTNIYQFSV